MQPLQLATGELPSAQPLTPATAPPVPAVPSAQAAPPPPSAAPVPNAPAADSAKQPIVQPPTAQPPLPLTSPAWFANGLDYLAHTSEVLVRRRTDPLEAPINFDARNKYDVVDQLGEKIYVVVEESSLCCQYFCFNKRSLVMHVYDSFHTEVLRLVRPYRPSVPWCCFCQQVLRVYAPPRNCIGTVEQTCRCTCRPKYQIRSAENVALFNVRGPLCPCCSCCGDVVFSVKTVRKTEIGKISRAGRRASKQLVSDAYAFGVTYPADLDVSAKAQLLAAAFLIVSQSTLLADAPRSYPEPPVV